MLMLMIRLKMKSLENQVGMDTAEVESTEKGDEY